jgi:uncharacterized protein (DUF1778 family)
MKSQNVLKQNAWKPVLVKSKKNCSSTLTDFVISSLQTAAKQAIQEHEIMILSRRDQEVFVEALLNSPAPSVKLRTAAQLYKQKMGA